MPLSVPLKNILKKGQFPLLSESGVGQWNELITALELNAATTFEEIREAMDGNGMDCSESFPSEITVNDVEIDTGQTTLAAFLGAAHARLCDNYGIASRPQFQSLIQRLRGLMAGPALPQSKVTLGLHPKNKMGNGLVSDMLTCRPDPAWGINFGSEPDQEIIGNLAPHWNILKRRAYEAKVLVAYGGKPHYVLAHLLNHNLNGSGEEPRNVVPFWGGANTEMAKKAECHVKELVQRGAKVQYFITLGAAVGMTPARKALQAQCDTPEQWELIQCEAFLPSKFIITCNGWDDAKAQWVTVVNNLPIDNYVPETVPYLRKKGKK
ncbi:MAG: hypothetical protein ACOYMG_09020 [Candidatus Methylumidiphilus sp.]